jgi:hypothetical protein
MRLVIASVIAVVMGAIHRPVTGVIEPVMSGVMQDSEYLKAQYISFSVLAFSSEYARRRIEILSLWAHEKSIRLP